MFLRLINRCVQDFLPRKRLRNILKSSLSDFTFDTLRSSRVVSQPFSSEHSSIKSSTELLDDRRWWATVFGIGPGVLLVF